MLARIRENDVFFLSLLLTAMHGHGNMLRRIRVCTWDQGRESGDGQREAKAVEDLTGDAIGRLSIQPC